MCNSELITKLKVIDKMCFTLWAGHHQVRVLSVVYSVGWYDQIRAHTSSGWGLYCTDVTCYVVEIWQALNT